MRATTGTLILVRVRGKGFSAIAPPAEPQPLAQTVGAALGLQGGYIAAEIEYTGDPEARSVWAAWVEGSRAGRPYVDYRFYPEAMSEAELQALFAERGEEVLDLQFCAILRPFA